LLHCCSNARQHALRRWKLSFGHLSGSYHLNPARRVFKSNEATIFFDALTDTLYFGEEFLYPMTFAETVDIRDREPIRKVAFHPKGYQNFEPFPRLAYCDILERMYFTFPQIETVVWAGTNLSLEDSSKDASSPSYNTGLRIRKMSLDKERIDAAIDEWVGKEFNVKCQLSREDVVASFIVSYFQRRREWEKQPNFEHMLVRPRSGRDWAVKDHEVFPSLFSKPTV
jgi:hypothetical protein